MFGVSCRFSQSLMSTGVATVEQRTCPQVYTAAESKLQRAAAKLAPFRSPEWQRRTCVCSRVVAAHQLNSWRVNRGAVQITVLRLNSRDLLLKCTAPLNYLLSRWVCMLSQADMLAVNLNSSRNHQKLSGVKILYFECVVFE